MFVVLQACNSGIWVDEYACVPPVRGVPGVCVGPFNDPYPNNPKRAWLGLDGCNCNTACGVGVGLGGFCCWDGSMPVNISSCDDGDVNCQTCGGGLCPAAPSDSTSPTPGRPTPSQSVSPTMSSTPSGSLRPDMPPAASTDGDFRFGELSGTAALAVVICIAVGVLAVFVGTATYCYRRGQMGPSWMHDDDNPSTKLNVVSISDNESSINSVMGNDNALL
jgi:hypothetical protein